MRTRLPIYLIVALVAMLIVALPAAAAPHEGNPGGNCDGFDGPNKVETSDGSIVLDAGTIFCVKQENSNTGTLIADGVTTLAEYAEQAGLNPGVSNYVTYGTVPSEPAESEPAESIPAESEPAESIPAESEPAESTPAESEPAASVPAVSTPAESQPLLGGGTPPTVPDTATSFTSTPWLAVGLGLMFLGAISLMVAVVLKQRRQRG